MNSQINEKEESKPSIFYLFLAIFIVLIIWALNGYFLYPLGETKRGTFGDMFGAINALFSGLAFATLIYTIYIQRYELELQRKELVETRKEIKGQKEYLAAQNEVLRTQNFENTFFQLLKLLNEITDSVTEINGSENSKGKKAFDAIYRNLLNAHLFYSNKNLSNSEAKDKNEVLKEACDNFFINYQEVLGHYFRTLYNIIKLVKESNVSNKRFYTNLVRAQITNKEVLVIFYDGISCVGSEKFKPLIEEFALLKTIRTDKLIDPSHIILYSETAYK